MKNIYVILRLSLLILLCGGSAAASDYYYKQISLNEGLSQSSVRSILRDSRGFLWFGTKIGLNKYDYQTITTYYHDPNDPTSITNNEIRLIFEDSLKQVWVATETGTSIYDHINDRFKTVTVNNQRLDIRAYFQLPDGLLLGGRETIYKYSYETDSVTDLNTKGGAKRFYQFIGQLSDDKFVLASRWEGTWLYDSTTGKVSALNVCDGKGIMAAYIDSKKNLWLSPYGDGIYCFDRNLRQVYHATMANSTISSDIILNIIEKDGDLWMGTDGGGICILDPETKTFSFMNGEKNNFPENSIPALYKDEYDNIFAGTVHSGAFCIQDVAMHTFTEPELRAVTSIMREKDGTLWIGSDGQGLKRLNADTKQITNYPSTNGMKITSLAQFDDDGKKMVIAVFGKGLYLFDKATGSISQLPFIRTAIGRQIMSKALHIELKRGDDNKLYLFADGIYVYDIKTESCTHIELPKQRGDFGHTSCFYIDNKSVWIYDSNNIMRYDIATGTTKIVAKLRQKYKIRATQYDGSRYLYMATEYGLIKYDTSNRKYSFIKSNLMSGVSTCLLDGNRLWIGAANMLLLYRLNVGKFMIFSQADGVEPNEFISRAAFVSDGRVFLGGVNGLLTIDNSVLEEISDIESEISIDLCGIDVDGVQLFSKVKDGAIDVPSDHTSINIRIIEKEKNAMRKKMFRYYINNRNDNNVVETTDRSLALNMLSSGKYDIFVSCQRTNGDWTTPTHIVCVNVMKPWWLSDLAFVIYAVVLFTTLFLLVRYYSNKKRQQLNEKIQTYKQENLEREVDFLININHELRTPLTLIYAPLKLLLERLNKEKADDSIISDLSEVYKHTKKMRNVINMTLDLRRIEMGHSDLHPTNVEFNQWVKDTVGDFASEFRIKHIGLEFDLDENIGVVPMDKDKTEIVVNNFVMNALKYTQAESKIRIVTSLNGQYVRLSVKDSGPGLSGVDINKLFSKFYQGENAVFGSGLGLSYAKSLIDLQKGHIGVYNNTDEQGATFWFELPIEADVEVVSTETIIPEEDSSEAASIIADIEAKAPEVSTEKMTAVVVEDDVELCLFIVNSLKSQYGKVLHAFNGKNGMILIRNHLPDIVISDVMMPMMNGFEICTAIKSSPQLQNIPIILLTARVDEPSIQLGYTYGADSYLSKPFDVVTLITRCKNLLRTRQIIQGRYNSQEIMPAVVAAQQQSQGGNFNNADMEFMKRVNDIISENISLPDFGIDMIVDKMLMSRASVYSKFKSLTGHSIGNYINEYKLRRAKELLADKKTSVNEIADALGFRSQRYFSTFFKERTNMTPTEWRNSQKEGETAE